MRLFSSPFFFFVKGDAFPCFYCEEALVNFIVRRISFLFLFSMEGERILYWFSDNNKYVLENSFPCILWGVHFMRLYPLIYCKYVMCPFLCV